MGEANIEVLGHPWPLRLVGTDPEPTPDIVSVLAELSAAVVALRDCLLTRLPVGVPVESMSASPQSALVGLQDARLPRPTIGGVVTSVIDVWESEHRHTLDARYVAQVRSRLDAMLAHSGKAHAGQITRADVAAFLDMLSTAGERGKPIGPKTYTNYLLMFSGFFAWAVRAELLASNPCAGMRAPKCVKRKRRALTAGEVRSLLSGAPWPRSGLYRVLAVTGVRIGEARLIRRRNVLESQEPPVLIVPGQITKKKRDRVVALDPETAALLGRMCAGLDPDDFALKVPRYKTLQRDIIKAGIKPKDEHDRTAGWHSFRRFLPTELAKQGVSAEIARAQLGHASVQTTLEHYTDVGLQERSEAVNALASVLYVDSDSPEQKNVGKSVARGQKIADTHGATPMSATQAQTAISAPGLLAPGVATQAEGLGQTSPSAESIGSFAAMGATGLEPVAPNSHLLALADHAIAAVNKAMDLVRLGSTGAVREPKDRF